MNPGANRTAARKTRAAFRIPAAALLLAGVLAGVSGAQAPDTSRARQTAARMVIVPDPSRTVTEGEIVALALNRNRKLQSLTANVEIAQREASSAGGLPNPELRVGNLSTRNYNQEFDELRVGLRIRLPDLGELAEERQRARTDLWEQKVEEIRTRQELTARVRRDCADVLAEDRLTELAEKKLDLLNRRIGMIEQLIRIGDRSVVYYMKAKTMRAEAQNDFARAVQKQAAARRQLVKRTGLPPETPIAESALPEVPAEPDRLVSVAALNRPETEFVRQQVDLALKERTLERLKLLPWFNFIQFSYHREKNRDRDWGEVSAGIDLPLFNWNVGNIRGANLAVRKREARVDAVLETIEEEVRSAYTVYRDLWLDWNNFSASSETHIRDSETVVSQSSVHETLRSDEVLELELTVIETRRLLAEKKRDLANALSELLFAMGVESLEPLP